MSHKDELNGRDDNTGRTVELPVIKTKAPKMGQSKMARWRTGVLVMVNVLMIIHIIQWLIMGVTVSPIEPSEAMETLETGVVNAGAVMFLVAIVLTVFFGRFFCGWLCHMVALQDFCAVVMSRIGIRPRAFRSRLMMYIPLILGGYMFVWPTFKRLAVKPILESMGTPWPVWMRPVGDVYQYSEEFLIKDYWSSMPPWPIAIIFLIVCGFVAVYFLGAKGFCTYACPYAGFFKPLDKLAIMRVKVNDDCRQCGYCTSVCTSNVRVSDEVRDFGMVIDSGCMKTLDCMSACPNDALSIGIGGPSILKKPKDSDSSAAARAKKSRKYDLKLWEDIVAMLVFGFAFYATRGLFDRVPMLMAGGLAAVITMLCVLAYWMVVRDNVRFHKFQLKSEGRIRRAGVVFASITAVMVLVSVWSSHDKYAKWRGDMIFKAMDVPSEVLVRQDFMATPEMQAKAERGLSWYKRSDSFANGGYGWNLNPEHRVQMAYLYSVLGKSEQGLKELRRVIRDGNPTDALIFQAGQLAERSSGNVEGLLDIYREGLAAHPDLHQIRGVLAKNAWSVGDHERAQAYWAYEPKENPVGFLIAQAGYEGFGGDKDAALKLLRDAIHLVPTQEGNQAGWYIEIARGAVGMRMQRIMDELAKTAIKSPDATALTWLSAGELANALGLKELSVERADMALSMKGADRSIVLQRAAGIIADSGQPGCIERAMELLNTAYGRAESDYDRKYIIEKMIRIGVIFRNEEVLDTAFGLYNELAERRMDAPIFYVDLSFYLLQANRGEEAVAALEFGANIDDRNPGIAQRVSEVYMRLGEAEASQRWVDEAQRRQEKLENKNASSTDP